MNSICVYCGSSSGRLPIYAETARQLGRLFVDQKIRLVYGAGNIGLMGVIADTVLEGGGDVLGVIPKALAELEVAHQGLTELNIVQTMHERKAAMAAASDGFIAMPGGLGTFEELCEIATWRQLGFETKPIGILNVNNYYDSLLTQLDHAVDEGFLKPEHRSLVVSEAEPDILLQRMQLESRPG